MNSLPRPIVWKSQKVDVETHLILNGKEYKLNSYTQLTHIWEVYLVCFDDNQELPCPQEIVVKIYLDNEEQGSAQPRYDNERTAYRLAAEHSWPHVLKYYGEVTWKAPFFGYDHPGIAMEYCHGEGLSENLVQRMSTAERDQLCMQAYRLMIRMARAGFFVGDSNEEHIRIEWRNGEMFMKLLDFDQSCVTKPRIARIKNNIEMSAMLKRCRLDKD